MPRRCPLPRVVLWCQQAAGVGAAGCRGLRRCRLRCSLDLAAGVVAARGRGLPLWAAVLGCRLLVGVAGVAASVVVCAAGWGGGASADEEEDLVPHCSQILNEA